MCRELGLGFAQHALQTDFFGGNRSQLALSGVQCHGSERSLDDCLHDRFGKTNCPGSANNIASVVCASGESVVLPRVSSFQNSPSSHITNRTSLSDLNSFSNFAGFIQFFFLTSIIEKY